MISGAADKLVKSGLAPAVLALAQRDGLRQHAVRLACRLEKGQFFSQSARDILSHHFRVEIGAYSYGACFQAGAFPPGSIVGRYVSIADGVRAMGRNHPIERLSTHPFFYNRALGYVERDTIESSSIEVGSDAWIGHGAIATPGCSRIGIGAVIGAGAVVTKDVPNFAVVAGNPASVIRFRFEPKVRQIVLDSEWWNEPIATVATHVADMIRELPSELSQHPLLSPRNTARLRGPSF